MIAFHAAGTEHPVDACASLTVAADGCRQDRCGSLVELDDGRIRVTVAPSTLGLHWCDIYVGRHNVPPFVKDDRLEAVCTFAVLDVDSPSRASSHNPLSTSSPVPYPDVPSVGMSAFAARLGIQIYFGSSASDIRDGSSCRSGWIPYDRQSIVHLKSPHPLRVTAVLSKVGSLSGSLSSENRCCLLLEHSPETAVWLLAHMRSGMYLFAVYGNVEHDIPSAASTKELYCLYRGLISVSDVVCAVGSGTLSERSDARRKLHSRTAFEGTMARRDDATYGCIAAPFPRTTRHWLGCSLAKPLNSPLPAGSRVQFSLVIAGAIDVVVIASDGVRTFLKSCGAVRTGTQWEGLVTVGEKCSELTVCSRYPTVKTAAKSSSSHQSSNEARYMPLLVYAVEQ